jgi:hypothetical protein
MKRMSYHTAVQTGLSFNLQDYLICKVVWIKDSKKVLHNTLYVKDYHIWTESERISLFEFGPSVDLQLATTSRPSTDGGHKVCIRAQLRAP